jgi:(p)ppGpp synthase/HD superfamily hydrolase
MNTALVELARGVAIGAHAGQFDKAGFPYVEHPKRIASRASTPEEEVLAWLHDVVEDTRVTFRDLFLAGFPAEIVEQVDALTHRKNEPRSDYYERVRAFPAARRVKLLDVADNSSPLRLYYLDEETQVRLVKKYAKAREALEV